MTTEKEESCTVLNTLNESPRVTLVPVPSGFRSKRFFHSHPCGFGGLAKPGQPLLAGTAIHPHPATSSTAFLIPSVHFLFSHSFHSHLVRRCIAARSLLLGNRPAGRLASLTFPSTATAAASVIVTAPSCASACPPWLPCTSSPPRRTAAYRSRTPARAPTRSASAAATGTAAGSCPPFPLG